MFTLVKYFTSLSKKKDENGKLHSTVLE